LRHHDCFATGKFFQLAEGDDARPALSICRAEWEEKYPKWKWRDPTITAWRAEESDDPKPVDAKTTQELADEAIEAAAKAQEHADRLAKEAEIAKTRAKFRNV
jgi:hypothetical protein